MKRIFVLLLAVTLLSTTALFISCSKDDENEEQQEQKQYPTRELQDVVNSLETATKALNASDLLELNYLIKKGTAPEHLYIEVSKDESVILQGEVGLSLNESNQKVVDLDLVVASAVTIKGTVDLVPLTGAIIEAELYRNSNQEKVLEALQKANAALNLLVMDQFKLVLYPEASADGVAIVPYLVDITNPENKTSVLELINTILAIIASAESEAEEA